MDTFSRKSNPPTVYVNVRKFFEKIKARHRGVKKKTSMPRSSHIYGLKPLSMKHHDLSTSCSLSLPVKRSCHHPLLRVTDHEFLSPKGFTLMACNYCFKNPYLKCDWSINDNHLLKNCSRHVDGRELLSLKRLFISRNTRDCFVKR